MRDAEKQRQGTVSQPTERERTEISMGQDLTISREDEPKPEDVQFIQRKLAEYNLLHAPEDRFQRLAVFVRGVNQELQGGLIGVTYWGWLLIETLWVDESLRGKGIGKRLLEEAEQEGRNRGCHHAYLNTMSFQAPSFYERQGYAVFGVFDDMPPGHRRYLMRKSL